MNSATRGMKHAEYIEKLRADNIALRAALNAMLECAWTSTGYVVVQEAIAKATAALARQTAEVKGKVTIQKEGETK